MSFLSHKTSSSFTGEVIGGKKNINKNVAICSHTEKKEKSIRRGDLNTILYIDYAVTRKSNANELSKLWSFREQPPHCLQGGLHGGSKVLAGFVVGIPIWIPAEQGLPGAVGGGSGPAAASCERRCPAGAAEAQSLDLSAPGVCWVSGVMAPGVTKASSWQTRHCFRKVSAQRECTFSRYFSHWPSFVLQAV